MKTLGTSAIENFANLGAFCRCDHWIEAPEAARPAKDYWLASGRDSAWCDRCGTVSGPRSGGARDTSSKGVKARLRPRHGVGSAYSEFGPELICRDCFVRAGGILRRLARTDQLPRQLRPRPSGRRLSTSPAPGTRPGPILDYVESGRFAPTTPGVGQGTEGTRRGEAETPRDLARLIARLGRGKPDLRVQSSHPLSRLDRVRGTTRGDCQRGDPDHQSDPARALLLRGPS